MNLSKEAIPAHIPKELVQSFDFFIPGSEKENPYQALKRLHDGPDIFWTPENEGHWVITRGEDI